MKSKYTQLAPQSVLAANVPLECHLEMLGVTLTQCCAEKHISSHLPRILSGPPIFFLIQDQPLLFEPLSLENEHSSLKFNTMYIPVTTIDGTIEHIICFIDRKARDESYPKCEACGLPRHSINQCHPLVNFSLAQDLCSHHLNLVRKIKAAYKIFSYSARGRPSRPSTIKYLVAEV
jgi:hypothetical protein